jgi:rhodanese-related sulfurtransferase
MKNGKTIRESTMKINRGWIMAMPLLVVLACPLPSRAQATAGKMNDPQMLQEMSAQIPRIPMPSVKPKALTAWLAARQNVLSVDLRAAEDFNRQHLTGAVNLPLNALPDRYQELPLDRAILLVDADGTTTLLAGSYLKRKGFRDLVRLFGGMDAWRLFDVKNSK